MDTQNTQTATNMWNTFKTGFTGAVTGVKNWYTNYKNSDYKQIRRKCSAEITLCTKTAPDTPIQTIASHGDISLSLVDLGMIAAAGVVLCGIVKFIRCQL